MSKKKSKRLAPAATPWDATPDVQLTPSQRIVAQTHKSMYAFRHESFDGDIGFINAYIRKSCPLCNSNFVRRSGFDRKGIQRYLCTSCGKFFTPVTGTIFDDRKLPISAWVDFLIQLFSHDSISSMTREERRSSTTTPYWLAKVFSVLEDVQDNIILSGTIQIDETYFPVALRDKVLVDGKGLRGLSRNQMCIGVGCDAYGRSVFVWEGFGKTNSVKTMDAFGDQIKRDSHLVHDKEKGHHRLVRKLELSESAYNAHEICKLSDDENPLADVNRHCFLVKHFLKAHSGFDRDNVQGYLDVFHVIANAPESKMEKAAFVLDRAMSNPKTLRYRDFYKTRSGETDKLRP